MLSPKAQLSLRNAKEYFREHLDVGDYYAEGQKVKGEWFGLGAEKLGLKGVVKETEFLALCEGLHPVTGEQLTARKNSTRRDADGRTVANRRVFYDFTISPPKSVSVVALMQDERILGLHNEAVKKAMVELEKFAETRVRKAGQRSDRTTGNVVAAAFRHDTSRELDPHLHTHCVVLNATFDPVENRWKALEVSGMYRAQKLVKNLYFHELAKGLRALGYEIESNARNFEIKNVPANVITLFSKRHQQISEETQKRIEREGLRGNVKDVREQVARDGRKRKIKDSTASNLRPMWMKQLTETDQAALGALRMVSPRDPIKADVNSVVAWADEHLFERRSVVNDYELMAAALAHGRGQDFDLAALRAAIDGRGYVREAGTHKLTSRDMLRCEYGIVIAARDGRGMELPLNPNYPPPSALSSEQAVAVKRILNSRDFITLFRGSAGTGKSFTLREVTKGIQAVGLPVVVLAPQRQQVADLCADGLAASTLAHCLQTKTLPKQAVVLVDEAGQIGGKQLAMLIDLVKTHDGRLILSGDTRQHGAVQAADALRAIEKFSGLRAAVLRDIRRQNPDFAKSAQERAFVKGYRQAVKAASSGFVIESFDRLDRLGCIRETTLDERREKLAQEYLASLDRKERTLVVAQTWAEVNAVNDAIREQMKARGKLSGGTTLTAYQAVDGTEAQKREASFYQAGQHAYFFQRYGRFAKSDLCLIAGANEQGVVLVKNGRRSTLSYRYANRYSVTAERDLEVALGDRLQLKFNGESKEGRAITNGELVTVRRVRKDGSLVVEDDAGTRKTLIPGQRLFNRGYAVTSYASQGKTVDTVLISDAGSRPATNRNQWYVAISRGRKRVMVFTDNKAELRANIEQSGDRSLALEMKLPASVSPANGVQAWLSELPQNSMAEQARRHEAVMQLTNQPTVNSKITL
jgi:conjugative relaxase-like TrwC/TraI family protein